MLTEAAAEGLLTTNQTLQATNTLLLAETTCLLALVTALEARLAALEAAPGPPPPVKPSIPRPPPRGTRCAAAHPGAGH